jgi:hypothetical protein
MKRTSMRMKVLLSGVSLLPFTLSVDAQAVTENIVSDSTWTVTDTNGNDLGNAHNVCLNATAPTPPTPHADWEWEWEFQRKPSLNFSRRFKRTTLA